jgi:hypothetical protein
MAAPTATQTAVLGGWTNFNFTLTPKAKEVFKEALKGFVGVGYTPLAFATQVVAGTNWCFLAKGTVPVPGTPETAVLLYIYEPLEGSPHITEIERINPGM